MESGKNKIQTPKIVDTQPNGPSNSPNEVAGGLASSKSGEVQDTRTYEASSPSLDDGNVYDGMDAPQRAPAVSARESDVANAVSGRSQSELLGGAISDIPPFSLPSQPQSHSGASGNVVKRSAESEQPHSGTAQRHTPSHRDDWKEVAKNLTKFRGDLLRELNPADKPKNKDGLLVGALVLQYNNLITADSAPGFQSAWQGWHQKLHELQERSKGGFSQKINGMMAKIGVKASMPPFREKALLKEIDTELKLLAGLDDLTDVWSPFLGVELQPSNPDRPVFPKQDALQQIQRLCTGAQNSAEDLKIFIEDSMKQAGDIRQVREEDFYHCVRDICKNLIIDAVRGKELDAARLEKFQLLSAASNNLKHCCISDDPVTRFQELSNQGFLSSLGGVALDDYLGVASDGEALDDDHGRYGSSHMNFSDDSIDDAITEHERDRDGSFSSGSLSFAMNEILADVDELGMREAFNESTLVFKSEDEERSVAGDGVDDLSHAVANSAGKSQVYPRDVDPDATIGFSSAEGTQVKTPLAESAVYEGQIDETVSPLRVGDDVGRNDAGREQSPPKSSFQSSQEAKLEKTAAERLKALAKEQMQVDHKLAVAQDSAFKKYDSIQDKAQDQQWAWHSKTEQEIQTTQDKIADLHRQAEKLSQQLQERKKVWDEQKEQVEKATVLQFEALSNQELASQQQALERIQKIEQERDKIKETLATQKEALAVKVAERAQQQHATEQAKLHKSSEQQQRKRFRQAESAVKKSQMQEDRELAKQKRFEDKQKASEDKQQKASEDKQQKLSDKKALASKKAAATKAKAVAAKEKAVDKTRVAASKIRKKAGLGKSSDRFSMALRRLVARFMRAPSFNFKLISQNTARMMDGKSTNGQDLANATKHTLSALVLTNTIMKGAKKQDSKGISGKFYTFANKVRNAYYKRELRSHFAKQEERWNARFPRDEVQGALAEWKHKGANIQQVIRHPGISLEDYVKDYLMNADGFAAYIDKGHVFALLLDGMIVKEVERLTSTAVAGELTSNDYTTISKLFKTAELVRQNNAQLEVDGKQVAIKRGFSTADEPGEGLSAQSVLSEVEHTYPNTPLGAEEEIAAESDFGFTTVSLDDVDPIQDYLDEESRARSWQSALNGGLFPIDESESIERQENIEMQTFSTDAAPETHPSAITEQGARFTTMEPLSAQKLSEAADARYASEMAEQGTRFTPMEPLSEQKVNNVLEAAESDARYASEMAEQGTRSTTADLQFSEQQLDDLLDAAEDAARYAFHIHKDPEVLMPRWANLEDAIVALNAYAKGYEEERSPQRKEGFISRSTGILTDALKGAVRQRVANRFLAQGEGDFSKGSKKDRQQTQELWKQVKDVLKHKIWSPDISPAHFDEFLLTNPLLVDADKNPDLRKLVHDHLFVQLDKLIVKASKGNLASAELSNVFDKIQSTFKDVVQSQKLEVQLPEVIQHMRKLAYKTQDEVVQTPKSQIGVHNEHQTPDSGENKSTISAKADAEQQPVQSRLPNLLKGVAAQFSKGHRQESTKKGDLPVGGDVHSGEVKRSESFVDSLSKRGAKDAGSDKGAGR